MARGFRMGVGGGVESKKIVLFQSGKGQLNTDVMGTLGRTHTSGGSFTVDENEVKMQGTSSSTSGTYNCMGSYSLPIDFTKIKKLCVHVTSLTSASFVMCVSPSTNAHSGHQKELQLALGDNILDIQSIMSNGTFGYFTLRSGVNTVATCTIDKIWVELYDKNFNTNLLEVPQNLWQPTAGTITSYTKSRMQINTTGGDCHITCYEVIRVKNGDFFLVGVPVQGAYNAWMTLYDVTTDTNIGRIYSTTMNNNAWSYDLSAYAGHDVRVGVGVRNGSTTTIGFSWTQLMIQHRG